jgi:hypothetical protein
LLENETFRNSVRFLRTSLAKGWSVEKPAVFVMFRHWATTDRASCIASRAVGVQFPFDWEIDASTPES